jgi:4-hydroxythreonine-4-phosphate dehydrogenase
LNQAELMRRTLLFHQALQRLGKRPGTSRARPRIAMCGLNPHASEGGLFGDEEERIVIPSVAELNRRLGPGSVEGPFPADTVFRRVVEGEFDGAVALYHDQGLIPLKLLAFEEAVNVSLGLPIMRTSPDHGTAFDIAGRGQADPGSMLAAIRWGLRLLAPGKQARAERGEGKPETGDRKPAEREGEESRQTEEASGFGLQASGPDPESGFRESDSNLKPEA